MIDVLIYSPFSSQTSQGNSVTALRLERILKSSELDVLVDSGAISETKSRCLVALNAKRSADVIAGFKDCNPESKVIIILTGTDINHPDAQVSGSATWKSLEMADHLVLLHEGSLVAVPQIFHSKCTVIYPSVSLPEGVNYTPEEKGFAVLMAGNMRKEKNPELAMAASAMISPSIGFHVYGESSESGSGRVIEHGVVSHDEIITAMSKAQLLLNTSHQEGGSNSICEAISMGLPVIASDIPGNSGMLGDDYAGLFPPNDLEALVLILGKAATEQEFYAQLKKQISDRAPLFSFAREAAAWRSLLESIIN